MSTYEGDANRLIADVDCTTEGQSLCEKVGVQGYPTIKYGDPTDLQDYEGGRDLEDLKKFAEESLGPSCGPANLDLCDADKKKQIEDFMAMGADALDAKIKEKKAEGDALEATFKAEVKKLQETYEKLQKDKDEGLKAVKESGLGLMQAVAAHMKKTKSEL
eukprot:gnl/MRDRNA2_/MRDRNA2_87108_c0_seq1.p1 gnl/MRDRNA2_/MRDRNA2_87108_c0~~gnl/MRDRNA2_/MRDRNA2_87108_c0_seq1.p1  ORF type:complete len:161 (+),score=57.63 gnl/MRDRNA2_/MRDRNA2_87108_c0_seq1:250-732(+)